MSENYTQITFDDYEPKEREHKKQLSMTVAQKNDFIQNRTYSLEMDNVKPLTLQESKLFLYVVSKIKPTDEEFEEQVFYINDFFDVCGIDIKKTGTKSFQLIKDSLLSISSRAFWLKNGDSLKIVRLFADVEIIGNHRNARIKIKLDEKLKPYLLQLKGAYTSYTFKNIVCMKSKYSLRLYELFKSYLYKSSEITFEIEKLKELIDCSGFDNNHFAQFKKDVIEKAVAEINLYTDLKIDYVEYIKTGRRTTHIRFEFTDLTDVMQTDEEYDELMQRDINRQLKGLKGDK